MALITLLTDFGTRDYYVAALKGTLLGLVPDANIVDISHEVAPGDVLEAAFLLQAAAPNFPQGTVHLVVVDPGVGSSRRRLVVATTEAFVVAPDNGVIGPFLESSRIYEVDRDDLYLKHPGNTFEGRDRFAPIAAFLASGNRATDLGKEIHDAKGLPGVPSAPQRRPGALVGQIVHIDRFGNLISNIPSNWLQNAPFEAHIGSHKITDKANYYAELSRGAVGLLPGSLGTLEAAAQANNLAEWWNIRRGDEIRITML